MSAGSAHFLFILNTVFFYCNHRSDFVVFLFLKNPVQVQTKSQANEMYFINSPTTTFFLQRQIFVTSENIFHKVSTKYLKFYHKGFLCKLLWISELLEFTKTTKYLSHFMAYRAFNTHLFLPSCVQKVSKHDFMKRSASKCQGRNERVVQLH